VLPATRLAIAHTFSSVDAQFLELRKLQIEEIARVFRVPPHLLYGLAAPHGGNSETMGQEFLQNTLWPWIKRLEGEFSSQALCARRAEDRYFAEFQTDDLVRADIQARYDAYSKAIAARVLNPNEVRARENTAVLSRWRSIHHPNVQSRA